MPTACWALFRAQILQLVTSCSSLARQELEEAVAAVRGQLVAAQAIATRASGTWGRLRKERDFHRLHHLRVAQEKNKLIGDIKRLKVDCCSWEKRAAGGIAVAASKGGITMPPCPACLHLTGSLHHGPGPLNTP